MQQTFEVGDVLYILSKKGTTTVVPAIVIEVVSRKTISGDSVSYKVLASTAKGNVPFDLSKLEEMDGGDIFTDSHLLQEEMTRRMNLVVVETMTKLNTAIAGLNEECHLESREPAPARPSSVSTPRKPAVALADEDENIEVITLPDGQKVKARFKFPT